MIKNKTIYIFPGWQETTRRNNYKKLKTFLEKKKYKVILKNINWKENLSKQLFDIENNTILIGFSLGAVFAKMLGDKYKTEKILLLSMTEMKYFIYKKNIKELSEVCGEDFVLDIKKNLKNKNKQKNEIMFYGDKEGGDGDIIVKNTNHELTDKYIKEIIKILK